MSGTSIAKVGKRSVPTELRKRVGAFIRRRREQLGLTQGDIIRALGYKNAASVSNLEQGIEGLPTKRVYAWAEILQVERDDFFRFVTGEVARVGGATVEEPARPLNASEEDLLERYRRLLPRFQRQLLRQAKAFEQQARKIKKQKRR